MLSSDHGAPASISQLETDVNPSIKPLDVDVVVVTAKPVCAPASTSQLETDVNPSIKPSHVVVATAKPVSLNFLCR